MMMMPNKLIFESLSLQRSKYATFVLTYMCPHRLRIFLSSTSLMGLSDPDFIQVINL
jgi:hypothetical protein